MRFFNTTGPIVPADHYHVPPLERLDLDEILRLVSQKRYFLLHAPRQTGKTSALLHLRDLLNRRGEVRCVYANLEVAQSAREDVGRGIAAMLSQIQQRSTLVPGGVPLEGNWSGMVKSFGADAALNEALTRWSLAESKPLVLLLDEVDTLVGDTLIALLRQIRAGYDQRPEAFPQSVVLCGVRDIRDYRMTMGSGEVITGGSAVNIKAESFRLGDFDEAEVGSLFAQHTEETGQVFTPRAITTVWESTRGQPWLVNALAYQACFRNRANRDRTRPIRTADIREAREVLILRRDTHLDQLGDKLSEERVRRVIGPLLSGDPAVAALPTDDVQYLRDLGLIATDAPARIANPIYAEVVPRVLTLTTEDVLVQEPAWYVEEQGSLDVPKLLAAFQDFFREHSEHWVERFQYREAGPQLLLQAFLHRVVNSGGRIEREYGLGRGRTDLLIVWPVEERAEKTVVECKVLRRSLDRTIAEGVKQTIGYMDRCGAAAGHLVVFDRDPERSWKDRIFRREAATSAGAITIWGM